MTQCFVDVGCVSLSFATNSTGLCLLNSVRGGPHNTLFDEGMAHRIRPRLAVLGDWCERDSDCTLLTTGPAECVESTCRCSSGQQCGEFTGCHNDGLNFDNARSDSVVNSRNDNSGDDEDNDDDDETDDDETDDIYHHYNHHYNLSRFAFA
ncbi:hypothetical protein FJT64_001997 [Amphibalanus amphitrite]|uniref:Uncharacterized protein n=1 Tax=Amphibalanus amphitrite TaxID=1232801 RepID=A0A6A4X5Y7_AMPAM|nr:hypothetical protein FJT64_001997 [Amphibalanus amphitrite]